MAMNEVSMTPCHSFQIRVVFNSGINFCFKFDLPRVRSDKGAISSRFFDQVP